MYLWKSIIKLTMAAAILGSAISANAQTVEAMDSPLIKAGAVTFARLETPVEGENPKQIITATIIDGKFKGAKIQGKLISVDNKQATTTLVFNLMSIEGKDTLSKKITAYAIDFDTARVAIVTEAEFPWLKRRSLDMATSFLKNNYINQKLKMGIGSDFGILFMTNVS